jgi:uncharacterized membrane protein (UPF0127 family)
VNRRWRTLLVCAALGGALLPLPACKNSQRLGPSAPAALAGAPAVVVRTAAGRAVSFRVELARTEAERAQGLMYRQQLAPDAGMLFLFEESSPLTFWMKNTFIPLDMIFIGSDRRIVGIVQNAEPRTLSGRHVDGSSQYVLEIGGGVSAKLGIAAGDEVDFRDVPAL